MTPIGTVLVAGASGFVGAAVVERFAALGWEVVGLSRRRPFAPIDGVDYRQVDLLDAEACRALASDLTGVTHLVYAAVNETPGELVASWMDPEHAGRNGAMFENLLAPLIAAAPGLRHVSLMHGTKAYASHRQARPIVPMRESLPRPDDDDFYFRQEDALWTASQAARAEGRDIDWTVLRAPMITGGGQGSNLNCLLAVCVYASVCKAQGRPLSFPGSRENLGVMEMVDVELLARAAAWAAGAPAAHGQVFNVANGDVYVWPDLWPVIAGEIGLPVGEPLPMSLHEAAAGWADTWAALVRRYGLAAPEDPKAFMGESFALADFAIGNCGKTVLTSTVKIRQAGFHDCVDTADSVLAWIRRWRAEALLPPA